MNQLNRSASATPSRTSGLTRRGFLAVGGVGVALASGACAPLSTPTGPSRFTTALDELEQSSGVTIGISAENLATRRKVSHRADDSFPMCSLFKVLAVGALAASRSPYDEFWSRPIPFTAEDLVENSPITSTTTTWTMSASELADAALRFSDNTAGNLLLKQLGGPAGVTEFATSLGASATRLDRWEPQLNEALPGDARDTSTPRDIASLYKRLLVDETIGMLGQARLRDWMLRNTTSDKRIRAGIDGEFELADKTGAGSYGVVNDAGVLWRPDGSATVLAILTRTDRPDAVNNNDVVAETTRLVVKELTS
jgi:beta-lactamase class A